MASFFEQQAQARKVTTRLLILFGMAVVTIVALVTLLAHIAITTKSSGRHYQDQYGYRHSDYSNPADYGVDGMVAMITLAAIGIGTLVRMAQIGSSGANVALMMGGVPISPSTRDPHEKRLMNIVEEMSIASSVPVPKVFVMPNESGINAFAAGMEPSKAVIGVTQGTLETLTRDELQGVIAHEFSHIFNGDMKLNLRLIGVLGGILVLATIGRGMMRARGKNSGGIVMAGLALFILGYAGVFFGRLIKAAVSRQREFLADASAVQYTRNPLGIGGALMKIRGMHSTIENEHAEEASHMFFGSALSFSSLFATHPPLEERIQRVAPAILKEGAWSPSLPSNEHVETEDDETEQMISKLAFSPTPRARAPEEVMKAVGAPKAEDLAAAHVLIQNLPAGVKTDLRRIETVREVLACLLLEPGGGSAKQHGLIQSALGPASLERVLAYTRELGAEGSKHRLSILQLALQAYRTLDAVSQRSFLVLARELVFADQKYDLFEYVALTIIESQADGRRRRPSDAKPTKRDIALVMSALSYAGSSDPRGARVAFDCGLMAFSENSRPGLEFCPADQCKFELLSPAVWRLAHAQPQSKAGLIEACVRIIMTDRQVSQEENELLHAVCCVLEAPLPVMAAG